MNLLLTKDIFISLLLLTPTPYSGKNRLLIKLMDATNEVGKGLLSSFKKYELNRIDDYIKLQYQVPRLKGAKTCQKSDSPALEPIPFIKHWNINRFECKQNFYTAKSAIQLIF